MELVAGEDGGEHRPVALAGRQAGHPEGALVGAGLGASGAALQGALRNPLAEPYLLGVSGGAAVGAVIAFALGISSDGVITLAAFLGGIGAVFVALAVARVGGRSVRADVRTLLIAGVIVGVVCCEQIGRTRVWTQPEITAMRRAISTVNVYLARLAADDARAGEEPG